MALQVLRIVAIAAVSIGTLMLIVGLATHHWENFKGQIVTVSIGLWQMCVTANDVEACGSFSDDDISSAMRATRALAILAVFFGVAAVGWNAALIAVDRWTSKIVAVALCILAGVLAFVGIIVFSTAVQNKMQTEIEHSYDYSFILTIVGAAMCILGSVFSAMEKNTSSSYDALQ